MLSDKQYEAIGRFTQVFNQIEDLVHFYAKIMLDPNGAYGSVAEQAVSTQNSLEKKRVLLKHLIKAVASDNGSHPSLVAQAESAMLLLEDRIRDLAKTRNTIVHGMAHTDPKTKKVVIEYQTRNVDCDEILKHTAAANQFYSDLQDSCFEVFKELSTVL
jgi:hypothetical protein